MLSLVVGSLILCALVPLVGPVVFASMVWEYVDRGCAGGFIGSGRELSGVIMSQVAPWFNQTLDGFNLRFVRNPADTFIITCIYAQGIFVPTLFLLAFWHTTAHGFSPVLCFAYHVVRIGPYFMQFAYYYVLCHKEGHTRTGFYSAPYNSFFPLRHIFNW